MASRWKDVANSHVELGAQVSSLDLLTTGLRYSYCLIYPSLERPTFPMRSLSLSDDHFPLDTEHRAACSCIYISQMSLKLCVPPLESRHSDKSG
jgi:hypothetical protein